MYITTHALKYNGVTQQDAMYLLQPCKKPLQQMCESDLIQSAGFNDIMIESYLQEIITQHTLTARIHQSQT